MIRIDSQTNSSHLKDEFQVFTYFWGFFFNEQLITVYSGHH